MKRFLSLLALRVFLVGVIAYSVIQGSYIFRDVPEPGNAIFTEWSFERTLDWPLGETVYTKIWPTSNLWADQFPPTEIVTVDRFFYKKTYERPLYK